jgi:hypothetical protein
MDRIYDEIDWTPEGLRSLARRLDDQFECTEPAYGVPGHAHCAACCYGTGMIVESDEAADVVRAAEVIRRLSFVTDARKDTS